MTFKNDEYESLIKEYQIIHKQAEKALKNGDDSVLYKMHERKCDLEKKLDELFLERFETLEDLKVFVVSTLEDKANSLGIALSEEQKNFSKFKNKKEMWQEFLKLDYNLGQIAISS